MKNAIKNTLFMLALLASPAVFTGCGGIEDAFQSTEKTVDNTIYINKNEKSIIHIPITGVSDPVDLNSTDPLPPSAVEFTITNYPAHGTLLFTSNLAVYTPAVDYAGKDFYSFEIYDTYKDEITTYNITLIISNNGDLPTISGDPALKVTVGTPYSFTPTVSDPDTALSDLTFSISNKPVWASFDNATGKLYGTPDTNDIGDHAGITISVSDDISTVSLSAFTITVVDVAQNLPPTIGGTPTTVIDAEQPYLFEPIASDPEGDTLLFGIANKPAWATFSTTTGVLSGTPTAGDIGISALVTISVTDSIEVVALPDFTIEVK